jgi:hypothetical protein
MVSTTNSHGNSVHELKQSYYAARINFCSRLQQNVQGRVTDPQLLFVRGVHVNTHNIYRVPK